MPSLSRRAFLTRFKASAEEVAPIRPPWSNETRIEEKCTGCAKCISACPEGILFSHDNRPYLKPGVGECTFCEKCAQACDEEVFDLSATPWNLTANLDEAKCLLADGVSCQTCTDICEPRALRFDMRVRPAGKIILETEACTGCSACLTTCPTQAISLKSSAQESQSNA